MDEAPPAQRQRHIKRLSPLIFRQKNSRNIGILFGNPVDDIPGSIRGGVIYDEQFKGCANGAQVALQCFFQQIRPIPV